MKVPEIWHRVDLAAGILAMALFHPVTSAFQVNQARVGSPDLQVPHLTHLLVKKNSNSMCICLVNVCPQRNVGEKKKERKKMEH